LLTQLLSLEVLWIDMFFYVGSRCNMLSLSVFIVRMFEMRRALFTVET